VADARRSVHRLRAGRHQLEEATGLTEAKLRSAWDGSGEIARKFADLAAALRGGSKLEKTEFRAVMQYGVGDTVSLELEDGVWKINDL